MTSLKLQKLTHFFFPLFFSFLLTIFDDLISLTFFFPTSFFHTSHTFTDPKILHTTVRAKTPKNVPNQI